MDLKNEAENLCYAAEKLISENGDKIGNEDKDQINKKVAALKEAFITKDDADLIKAGTEDLQKMPTTYPASCISRRLPAGAPGQYPLGAIRTLPQPDGNGDAEYKDVDDQNK